jgi:hypothetical protein
MSKKTQRIKKEKGEQKLREKLDSISAFHILIAYVLLNHEQT